MVMASAGVNNMPQGEGPIDSEECRLRRRRRYVHASSSAPAPAEEGEVLSPPPSSSSSSEESGAEAEVSGAAPKLPAGASTAAASWPVAFGSVALAGRLREMEDTVSLHPSFCAWADGSPMHLFAVFDGHGGPHAAALCREQMHVILAEELAGAAADFNRERREQHAASSWSEQQQQTASSWSEQQQQTASSWSEQQQQQQQTASSWSEQQQQQQGEELAWRGALSRSFARADPLAGSACACGQATLPSCSCPLSGAHKGAIVGSTAVVALLVRDRLIVANCGDSRAVLSRGGVAVPLSEDQKPDRPDEMARIKAAGGNVMFLNGARVRGILAMSRALGHRLLKPEVICEPEITITERSEDDDCLILASDGLWDVISNKLACDVARQCLEDGNPTRAPAAGSSEAAAGSSSGSALVVCQEEEPRCFRAAALLARLALGRESSDNISVIVVDLKERG